jgi:nuclease HARBI1
MSKFRECVEWGFGKVVATFAFVDYKKNQKVYLQPVGRMYMVAVLMTNIHTCSYNSQTGQYFELDPPNIREYLNIV